MRAIWALRQESANMRSECAPRNTIRPRISRLIAWLGLVWITIEAKDADYPSSTLGCRRRTAAIAARGLPARAGRTGCAKRHGPERGRRSRHLMSKDPWRQ